MKKVILISMATLFLIGIVQNFTYSFNGYGITTGSIHPVVAAVDSTGSGSGSGSGSGTGTGTSSPVTTCLQIHVLQKKMHKEYADKECWKDVVGAPDVYEGDVWDCTTPSIFQFGSDCSKQSCKEAGNLCYTKKKS